MTVKKTKKESQYFGWANARRVELLSHLQSHTAAVHIATRRGSKHWTDSVCCLLLQSACANSTSRQKILVGATNKCYHEQLFSAAGQIYSDRRDSLLGENAEKLLFLEYNIRLFDFKYRYWSLHAELMLPNDVVSDIVGWSVIMCLSRNIFFSCICYFMLPPTSANHNCNHKFV